MELNIVPLAARLADADVEAARAARRALRKIIRGAGRPGAEEERKAVCGQLMAMLKLGQPAAACREALWMLSEIGGDESAGAIAALLASPEWREDARQALERIPGKKSLAALKEAFEKLADFKIPLAQSLRARGAPAAEAPCVKLKPVKPTGVKRGGEGSKS